MHYFKRSIGDYHKKAGRLTMLQHGAYTLLMDACYDREEFPTLEQAIDWCWATTEEEISAIKFVLTKFFEEIDGVYIQSRIKEEIGRYHEKSDKNKKIALEREEAKRQRANDESTNEHETCSSREHDVHETAPNQEPRTKNQEPINKNKSPSADLFERFWEACLAAYKKTDSTQGAKKRAFDEFKKLKPDETRTIFLINTIHAQAGHKIKLRDAGQFAENFQHVERWLKNQRWDDELPDLTHLQPKPELIPEPRGGKRKPFPFPPTFRVVSQNG